MAGGCPLGSTQWEIWPGTVRERAQALQSRESPPNHSICLGTSSDSQLWQSINISLYYWTLSRKKKGRKAREKKKTKRTKRICSLQMFERLQFLGSSQTPELFYLFSPLPTCQSSPATSESCVPFPTQPLTQTRCTRRQNWESCHAVLGV